MTKDFFVEYNVKTVLIPGIGYGRNAQIFRDNGMTVTGIEISETAINLGQKHFGNEITIYHGSVSARRLSFLFNRVQKEHDRKLTK